MHVACCREAVRTVTVGLMKRIADNPHVEHLGAEIAEED